MLDPAAALAHAERAMAEDPNEETAEGAPDSESEPEQYETSLKLTDVQMRRLLDHVQQRLETCCKDMGRGKDGRTVQGSWLDKRRINQLWYEGDMAWRAQQEYYGGVFQDSNFTRGDGKRYVRHMAAKIADDLLGTTPYFACMKTNGSTDSASLIKSIEQYVQDGVDDSNVSDTLREAIELALVRNEAVVKTRHMFDATGYLGPAEVLVDQQGAPVLTPEKRLYVYKNDDLLPVPMPPPAPGEIPQQPMFALEKDASFIVTQEQAQAMVYRKFPNLPQTQVQKDGLDARVLDPRDFIIPLAVDSIHEADICAHFYDERPATVKSVYSAYNLATSGYWGRAESGAKSPIQSQGEQQSTMTDEQWVPMGEVYVRFDADEDGHEEQILLVMDRICNNGTPLYCDYLYKHMKTRPFEVIHGLRKVPARWYGVGIYTDKFDALVFVDKTFNRINLKSSKTCTVTAVRRGAIDEWSDMKLPIRMGGDEILTINDKWRTPDNGPFIEQIRLIEVTEEEQELMLTMTQSMDLEFGLLSGADASASGLNSSETATGIASIERSGNNIVKAVEHVQSVGITKILEQCTDISLENLDPMTIVLTKEAELLTLSRDEIRDLPREVKLLLTRSRSSELMASNAQAAQVANQYFDMYDTAPMRAKALRPMYVNQLKSLEVVDADEMLPEVTDEDIAAWKQQRASAQAPQKPESLSISYSDAPDPIRRQMEAKAGMTPLTPEQEEMERQREAQEKTAESLRNAASKRLSTPPQSSNTNGNRSQTLRVQPRPMGPAQ